MTHSELMIYGRRIFNFGKDQPFTGVEHLLEEAKRTCDKDTYWLRCQYLVNYLANYADGHRS